MRTTGEHANFATPVDILLSELALESFFPADAETADWLRRAPDAGAPSPHQADDTIPSLMPNSLGDSVELVSRPWQDDLAVYEELGEPLTWKPRP